MKETIDPDGRQRRPWKTSMAHGTLPVLRSWENQIQGLT